METILSSPLHSQSPPFRISPHQPFTAFRPLRNHKFIPKISFTSINITPRIRFAAKSTSTPSESSKEQNDNVSAFQCLAKHLVHAVFCFAVGVSALGTFRVANAGATVTAPWTISEKKGRNHEFSDCTGRVLEALSGLLRSIEEVRKGDGDMKKLKRALKVVKAKKEEAETEIMERLYPELTELREVRGKLVKRELELENQILEVKREYVMLKEEEEVVNEEKKVRMERLEWRIQELEKKYNEILEKVYDVEDEMSRRETAALSYGILEVSFIERECEQLVEKFKRELRQKEINRLHHML